MIHYVQATSSTGDGASTLALKPMGGVNQSPKQRSSVAPQNGDLSPQKIFKKKEDSKIFTTNVVNGGS